MPLLTIALPAGAFLPTEGWQGSLEDTEYTGGFLRPFASPSATYSGWLLLSNCHQNFNSPLALGFFFARYLRYLFCNTNSRARQPFVATPGFQRTCRSWRAFSIGLRSTSAVDKCPKMRLRFTIGGLLWLTLVVSLKRLKRSNALQVTYI